MEEQYTQDALRAAERERGERKRAEELQETLRHSSYIDQQEKYICVQTLYLMHDFYAVYFGRQTTIIPGAPLCDPSVF